MVAAQFNARKPVAAICHGVLLPARSRRADGRSVLHGLRTAGLTRQLEMTAAWPGSYYRTYPTPLQNEVEAALARRQDFDVGPPALLRDDLQHLCRGFSLRDGHYRCWTALKRAPATRNGKKMPRPAAGAIACTPARLNQRSAQGGRSRPRHVSRAAAAPM